MSTGVSQPASVATVATGSPGKHAQLYRVVWNALETRPLLSVIGYMLREVCLIGATGHL